MSKIALICSCGVAASVFAADGVNTGRPVETSFRTSGIKAPVEKFDTVVAGPLSQMDLDSEAAMLARKTAALSEQVGRASTRAPFADAKTPNYFYFNNVAIPLNLRPQMALMIHAEGLGNQKAIAVQALANAGIAISPEVDSAARFVVVNLSEGAKTTEEMRTLLDRVLATGLVSFAAPVFDNELIDGGYRIPSPLIMVRADLEQSKVAAMPSTLSVREASIGPSEGVSQLASSSKNGFDVMAEANSMQTAPGIRWATVDFVQSLQFAFTPDDALYGTQWQHFQSSDIDMDSPLAWDFSVGSSAVATAVFDTGTQLNHPDLNASAGRNFTTGAVGGTGDGGPIDPCDNHGTAVAGCISARIDNAIGVAGGAPNTLSIGERIAELNTSNCNSFSSFQGSWLVNAINYALGRGAEVSNSSFGIGFDQAVSDAYSDTGDVMVHCASSGNSGVGTIGFPSSAPFVISCGGFNSSGTRYGNWGTGLDVCGPSVSVPSTDRTGSNGYSGNDYNSVTGTSFSSPLTASVAALFRSEFPFATAAETRTSVYGGCVDIFDAGYDTDSGYGRINLNNTLLDRANSNYDCARATTIPAVIGSFNPAVYSTRWALNKTVEPFEDCELNNAGTSSCVYYKFTPPYTGLIGINTNGSDYDTVLSVFESCSGLIIGTNPTQIACDDDGGDGTQSQLLNIPVTYGNQIIIKVSKYGMSGGGGNLDFNFQYTSTEPTNDFCSSAIVIPISGLTDSYTSPVIDNQLATTSSCENDESCGSSTNSKSVWWKFTAPYSGVVNLDTELSDFDTVLSVFPECAASVIGGCRTYASIACDDDIDGANNRQSRINGLNVNAQEDYLVKVSSFGTTVGGGARLRLAYTMSAPSNDDCANAASIPSANTAIQWSSPLVNARAATTEDCQNSTLCGLNNVRSIWWEFTPTRDGRMNINTVGSNYDTVLSVFTACARVVGSNCLGSSQLACNDDDAGLPTSRLSNFQVNGGTTYRFSVSAYNNGAAGDGKINIQWFADCPADWNDDDTVDFFDYLDFLDSFNSGTLAGDFNDDQVVDFFDYLDFVNSFSGGC